MTMTELHAHWDERERRYARHHRSLSDDERAIISAYRRAEVARLIAQDRRAAEDASDAAALAYAKQWSTS